MPSPATLAFVSITVLHIIFGELVPKSVALWNAESTAVIAVPPTEMFYRVFKPFIWALNMIANTALRRAGLRAPSGRHVAFDREELVMLISESRRAGAVEHEEESLVRRVFKLTDRIVGESDDPPHCRRIRARNRECPKGGGVGQRTWLYTPAGARRDHR